MITLARLCIALCLVLALSGPQPASSQESGTSTYTPSTQARFVVFEGFLRFT
jgi:hypothetical protein